MFTTICVPDPDFLQCVDPSVAGRALIWSNLGKPPPVRIDATTMLVVPYDSPLPSFDVVAALPNLRVIQLLSHGYESWMDLVRRPVDLCVARGLHAESTAEMAVGLLLYQVLEIPRRQADHLAGRWNQTSRAALLDLRVLILGAGDIGCRVADALAIFGAETTLVGRRERRGVRSVDDLRDLLPRHDVVVITAPLTPDTRGMVDAAFLASLPDNAIVVNVGRGAIVETEALVRELRSGRIRASLDVTDPEPLPGDHPLWQCPNLLVTSHLGGETRRWLNRARTLVGEQIERHIAGRPLVGRVMLAPHSG